MHGAEDVTCSCVNVPIGSYENQEALVPPWGGRAVGIDRCILNEVRGLWARGIRTIESCCGHNKAQGYIAVDEASRGAIEALGYRPHPDAAHVYALHEESSLNHGKATP
jgi:hypothetical protein